jgi:hypothetical protein
VKLEVLGTDSSDQWRDWVWQLPSQWRDIHWHPDLHEAYEKIYGYKAQLFVCTEGPQFAIQPVLRDHNILRHCYNFGGPLGSKCVGIPWTIVDWKRKEGIKTELCTLHPLYIDQQLGILDKSNCQPKYVKEAVYIDLTEPLALRTTHRQMLRYAEEGGATVVTVDSGSDILAAFARLYQNSMGRKSAADHWRFPDNYFPIMAECLGDKFTVFFGYVQGELEAGCILIHDFDTAYYHYAAAVGKHAKCGLGVSLVVACAQWCRAQGYKTLFLGGGVEPQDGLYLFKSGFSKHRASVYKYQSGLND